MNIPSPLDPTPAQGLAHDLSVMNPREFVREKSGVQTVAAAIGGGRIYNETGHDLVLENVVLRVGTAPTGADLIVDVNTGHAEDAAVSAFEVASTRPKIVAGSKTGSSVPRRGTLTAPTRVTLPNGDYLTVDVDQIGSTVAGSDLRVLVTATIAHPDHE